MGIIITKNNKYSNKITKVVKKDDRNREEKYLAQRYFKN